MRWETARVTRSQVAACRSDAEDIAGPGATEAAAFERFLLRHAERGTRTVEASPIVIVCDGAFVIFLLRYHASSLPLSRLMLPCLRVPPSVAATFVQFRGAHM